jgi:RIO-like serine/threonine protein kinase
MIDYIVGLDRMILEAILERSLTNWVNPIYVKRALALDETEFGDRLIRLEKWGLINTQSGTYEEAHSLENGINLIRLTDLGGSVLLEKR